MLGLAVALLLPQLLGLLHAVTHDTVHHATPVSQRPHAGLQSAAKGLHGHELSARSALVSLFTSHDEGSTDCRLYDQASHEGLAPTVAAFSLPLLTPGTGVALFAGDALARWAALFDARGPPLNS